MTVPTLAAPQYAKLRAASYAGEQIVSLFSNRVVFAGQVNSDLTTPTSWPQFNYNAVSVGAYTDVELDQVLIIGTTNDLLESAKSGYYGRIRELPTSSVIKGSESSKDFDVGDYFWVLDRFDPQYRYSRPSTNDPATAIELIDYNVGYAGEQPMILGLQTVYAGYVDATSGKLRLAFDISASYPVEAGATIASYLFTLRSGTGTLVAGALNSAYAVIDFEPGETWFKVTVTDNGGRTAIRHVGVKAHDDSNPPDLGFEGARIDTDISRGYSMNIPVFADVDSVIHKSLAVVWRNNELYGSAKGSLYAGGSAAITNKVLTSQTATLTATGHSFAVGQTVIVAAVGAGFDGTFVVTAVTTNTFSYHSAVANVSSAAASGMAVANPQNIDFVGWFVGEDNSITPDDHFSVIGQSTFRFVGLGPCMSRIVAELLGFQLNSSPTLWGQIKSLTPWRGIAHYLAQYTTIARLCDISFSDRNDQYLFPDLSTQGGNVLSAVQGIAAQINAFLEFSSSGQIAINRGVYWLADTERNLLPVVGAWDEQDFVSPGGIQRTLDPQGTIGRLDADGGFYNTANGQVVVRKIRAPGHAQDEAQGIGSLNNQILTAGSDLQAAIDELAQRAGDQFRFENNGEILTIDHPDTFAGLHQLIASYSRLYTFDIDTEVVGPNGVNRIVYDASTKWVCEGVSNGHSSELGQRTIQGRYRVVSPPGDPGDDITPSLPADNEIPVALPDYGLPAFGFEDLGVYLPDEGYELSEINPAMLLPPEGMVASFKGDELITWDSVSNKVFYEKNVIGLKKPIAVDITPPDLGSYMVQQCVVDPLFTNTKIPAKCLASDGTNSAVWYCTNIAAPGASGLWTKGDDVDGVYTTIRNAGTSGVLIRSLTGSSSTQVVTYDFTTSAYDWVGWFFVANTRAAYHAGLGFGIGTLNDRVQISRSGFGPTTYTHARIELSSAMGGGSLGSFFALDSSNQQDLTNTGNILFEGNISYTGVTSIAMGVNQFTGTYSGYVQKLILTVSNSAGPNARLSTDNGATFGTAISISTASSTSGGFDVQRSGGNSFAGATNGVFRATSIGGGYSSYYTPTNSAIPICIIIPYFNWAGTRQTASANPDIIVGLDRADGSSRTLLWIEGGATAGTVHDLTPVANLVFDNPNAITTSYNHHILVFGKVSGVAKVYRTTNRGSTWPLVSSGGSPTFIRTRRNDDLASAGSGTNKGQGYIADGGGLGYTSKWASAGFAPKAQPVAITGFDTIY